MAKETRGNKNVNEAIKAEIKLMCTEIITDEVINSISKKYFMKLEEKIDGKLTKLDKLDVIENKLSNISDSIASLESVVKANETAIQSTNRKCENIDQNIRNNSVRIYGIKENKEEDLIQTVCKLINEKLEIECSIQDIDLVYRIGKLDKQINNKPRPVIVKFVNNWKKSQIMKARKVGRNLGISLFEDLTKERYDLLKSTKLKYGKDKVWSFGGNIFAMDNGRKIRVTNNNE